MRAIIGNSFYSDVLPPDYQRPFVVLEETGTEDLGGAKRISNNMRLMAVSITFAVYGNNRPQVESILNHLENIFLDNAPQLTIDDRSHAATYFAGRNHSWDGEGWFGTLTLRYHLQKN